MIHRSLVVLSAFAWLGCSAAPPSPVAPVAASSASAAPGAASPLAEAPPPTPARPVTDVYFGTSVVDPYRWLEQPSPETAAWMKAQGDHARRVLDHVPGREALFHRIEELDREQAETWDLQAWGPRWFYLKTAPGQQGRSLYVRDGLKSPERVLVTPESLAGPGEHFTLDFVFPSLDGALVAYGASPGGSEQSVLHVIDTATGKALPDAIDRTAFTWVSWLDGRSFIYTRLQKLAPGAPQNAHYQRARAYVHVLGQDPERDQPILGHGLNPQMSFADDEGPYVYAPLASRYLVALVALGVEHEASVYVVPRDKLAGEKTPWVKIAGAHTDEVTDVAVHGDDLYALAHHGAPRYRVLKTSLAHPDLAHAEVVIPEGAAVVKSLAGARDALYVALLDGGVDRLLRVPYGGGAPEPVALPASGTTAMMSANPGADGARFMLRSWTASPRFHTVDAARKVEDAGLAPPSPADEKGKSLVSTRVLVKSADGTMVPLSIVHDRSLVRDGSHPAWLDGYGAYGFSRDPDFLPARFAWFERGGVHAICHVRGGGEFGEQWHRDGMLEKKTNGVADLMACAAYLVGEKYTTSARLALRGKSAAGVLIGNAVTAHPEAFGAALLEVCDMNAIRDEEEPNGPLNIPEFGTVKTEEGFRALQVQDAYHHVKDGVRYPAVLLTTGANDPRVPPWQSAKMTARLQAAGAGGKPVLLRVDQDAGHGSYGSTLAQRHAELADIYAFLLWQLGVSAAP